jgi:hypothetical protein
VNSTVIGKEGLIGFRFAFPPFRTSEHETDHAPRDFDLEKFCTYYGCHREDIVTHSGSGQRKRDYLYLIIKCPKIAVQILLRNARLDLAGAVEELDNSFNHELSETECGAGFGDAMENKIVEDAAIDAVKRQYVSDGWSVRSVERDRCGYDLECRKRGDSGKR